VSLLELTAVLGMRRASVLADTRLDAETTRLAVRAQAGDRDAFSALVDLHQRAARRVALAALPTHADADEAVQDACLTAWRSLDRLEDPAAFRAWLLRITWRKALDRRRSLIVWLRRFRHDEDAADEERVVNRLTAVAATPADTLLAKERDRVVAQLIRSLPARLRDPFLLAATGEHRYEEIAQLLGGIPLGTVKWRIAEARRVLREKLTRLGFGDGS
jgi:RNA polymerase sigma-70 factor (ECF subfamily)